MAKTIDAITLMKINQYLQNEGFECSLHSAGACDQSSLKVVSNKELDMKVLCDKINSYLIDAWIKVEVESPNSAYLKVI